MAQANPGGSSQSIVDKFTYNGQTYILQDNVSGYVTSTNIKTINGNSLIGSGNLIITASPTAMTTAEVDAAVQAGWGTSLVNANNIAY